MKIKALGLLKAGKTPKEIAEQLGVSYVTVLSWKKKMEVEDDEQLVSDIAKHTVVELLDIKDKAPETLKAEVGKLIDGVIGLKELEPDFHAAMSKAVKLADAFLSAVDDEGVSTLSIKEWQVIVKTLADAYSAIFNKAGTTVNVANNNVVAGKEALNFFKASKNA